MDVQTITAAALRGGLTEPVARQIYAMGTEATVMFTLAVNTRLAKPAGVSQGTDANTPLGAISVCAKGSSRSPAVPDRGVLG